ncbi:MAG TPA: HTH domain-containing protein, partial [Phycisphaerae bacterium]|nr:HTH domain-containing protein [Phycisphaerae bacterium]
MDVKRAAVQVLQEAKEPLTAKAIARRALELGLWQTEGKTPDATVAARIYSDIKSLGDRSPFVRSGPGAFALRDAAPAAASAANPLLVTPAAPGPKPVTKYSFTDAAEMVLEKCGDKKPMHYREITQKALELEWIVTEGKTPEATMYAQILMEVNRYQTRGEQPRFVRRRGGYVSLSRWMGEGLTLEIEQHNKRVREELHKTLLAMDPTAFEELIGRLLAEIGFDDIEVTQRSNDGGIDVRGTLVTGEVIRTRMAVQVKRWKPSNRVQAQVVQQVRGSLGTHEQGLIITTSEFSAGARTEAARPNAVP